MVGPTDSCAEKYTGPLCGSCAAGYFRDFSSGKCHACDEEAGLSSSSVVIVVLVALVVLYQVSSKCVRSKKREEEEVGEGIGEGKAKGKRQKKENEGEKLGEAEDSGFSAQFSTILVCWQVSAWHSIINADHDVLLHTRSTLYRSPQTCSPS